MNRYETKVMNLHSAVQRMQDAVERYGKDNSDDMVRDAMIQRFEFCYELSWKTLKAWLENHGIFDCTSPKSVLSVAWNTGLLSDESIWLMLMQDRNLTSHIYDASTAMEIASRITSTYLPAFLQLVQRLQEAD